MRTFPKYKQNLRADHNSIYSYNTNVASIDHATKSIHVPQWWSVTTSKHINYVASEFGYSVIKNYPTDLGRQNNA